MNKTTECIFIGVIAVILYYIFYKITIEDNSIKTEEKHIEDYNRFKKHIIFAFIGGMIVHYLVLYYNLNGLYCKKICYDDQCFMVCKLDNNIN